MDTSPPRIGAAALLFVLSLAAFIVLFVMRRLPVLKVAYNLAQLALGTVLAEVVFQTLASSPHPLSERSWHASRPSMPLRVAALAWLLLRSMGRRPTTSSWDRAPASRAK